VADFISALASSASAKPTQLIQIENPAVSPGKPDPSGLSEAGCTLHSNANGSLNTCSAAVDPLCHGILSVFFLREEFEYVSAGAVNLMKIRALLVLLSLFVAGCDRADLYTNLTEREANQMLAVLLEAGIVAQKKSGADGVSLMVSESQFGRAMSLLEARGLPSDRYTSLGEVFQKEGIVSSPVEERARYIYALSQELGQTIAQIDGVLNARIHVVLPETDMLGRGANPSSASVSIKHRIDAPIEALTPNIKMLVANSIEGLVYDNVTVVNFPASASGGNGSEQLPYQQFVGLLVHPGSLTRLKMMLGGLAALVVLGAGLSISTYLRANSNGRTRTSDSELL